MSTRTTRTRAAKVPAYRLHRASGQAVATFHGRDFYLGPHNSPESIARYQALVARAAANGGHLPDEPKQAADSKSVNEVLLWYVEQVRFEYQTRRRADAILARIKSALKPLRMLYGLQAVADFEVEWLYTLQRHLVDRGDNRVTINAKLRIIQKMFRVAARRKQVPKSVSHDAGELEPLRPGHSPAPEPRQVEPVSAAELEAVKLYLSPTVRDMVTVQALTGMRPGEVCLMRGVDIDRTGEVWIYTPAVHKTDWKGKSRTVALGPQAQIIIGRRMRPGHLFSPADEERERLELRHANRVTPLSCGNRPGTHRKRQRTRPPGQCYDTNGYRTAIWRACDKLHPLPADLARHPGEEPKAWRKRLGDRWAEVTQWRRDHRFSVNQIRHFAATRIWDEVGPEHAQQTLGHAQLTTTANYVKRNLRAARLAAEVARRIG